MRIGLIGYGNIGSVHFDIIRKLGHEVCAVCDIVYDKIKNLNVNKYTDYHTMLKNEKLDVVHICTPHYLHAEMIIAALNENINVLCEKPLCIKLDDIKRISEAEKKSSAKLGVCLQNRYNPENVFIKKYLSDKKPIKGKGEVVWKRDAAYYLKDEWRGKWKTEGGGVLINQALHTLDLLIWMFGEPAVINAKLENRSLKNVIEVEDTAFLACSGAGFEFDLFATNTGVCDNPISLDITTANEHIYSCNHVVTINGKSQIFDVSDNVHAKTCYGVGHEALFADFYYSIKNNVKFAIDCNEASKVVKSILSVYEKNKYLINK